MSPLAYACRQLRCRIHLLMGSNGAAVSVRPAAASPTARLQVQADMPRRPPLLDPPRGFVLESFDVDLRPQPWFRRRIRVREDSMAVAVHVTRDADDE